VQSAIGASMVPLRYLQTTAGLPSLAIIAVSDAIAFFVMSWKLIPKIEKRFWRSKTLWLMVLIVIGRTILMTFALRYTKAYIVQLINLLAPFFVILLNRLLKQSALPKYTVLAISLSVIGASLMIFGGLQNQSFQTIFTPGDGLGIFLAFLGTIGIAAYMMIVKRGQRIGLPFEVVYISQICSMMLFMSLLSLGFGENWSAFSTMDWRGFAALLFNAIGVEIGCKLGNITVLRKLGAPLVSSMLAVRLVAALFLGWFILGEQLSSLIQWGGVVLVVITITGYLTSLSQTELKVIVSDITPGDR
jgi:drug/metabolite transporter (DMT)-like permease